MPISAQVMTVSPQEQQTINYYNTQAESWFERHSSNPLYWQPELELFQKYLPQGAVLDIGCGAGRDAKPLLEMGYAYTGIDASTGLIEIAKKQVLEGRFLCQNVLDLDFPAASFDGFLCNAVLLHIPKERVSDALQSIKAVMKPGAVGFITVKEGVGTLLEEKTGRWFYLYTQDELAAILRVNGFAIECQDKPQKTPNVKVKNDWLTFFVRVQ